MNGLRKGTEIQHTGRISTRLGEPALPAFPVPDVSGTSPFYPAGPSYGMGIQLLGGLGVLVDWTTVRLLEVPGQDVLRRKKLAVSEEGDSVPKPSTRTFRVGLSR